MGKSRMVIIDGNSLIHRAFYALPPLTTREGLHTNAIYGFTTMLLKILEEYHPEYIGVAFDKKAPTFRHIEFEDYKAGRKKMPFELIEQMKPLKELIDAFNIYRIEIEGFEADDLIGTLAAYCEGKEIESFIVTGDKDALQLASDRIKVLITKKGISNLEIYDRHRILEEFNITPIQLIDVKGLMGDKSDNIPGVPGIGEKKAVKLIQQFGSVENLIQNTDEITSEKLREKIETHLQQVILSKRLATIVKDVPIEIHIEELRRKEGDYERIIDLFKKFEFNSLMNKIAAPQIQKEKLNESQTFSVVKTSEDLKKLVREMKEKREIAIKTITEEKNIITDEIVAMAVALSHDQQYYIDFRDFEDQEDLLIQIRGVLEDKNIKKYGHHLKKDIIHFLPYNIHIENIAFDTMIGEYLIDSSKSTYHLWDLSLQYLGEKILDEETLRGKGKNRLSVQDIPREKLKTYLCQQVRMIYCLVRLIKDKIMEFDMKRLYFEVELPLVEVLAYMEFHGIKVDKNMLKSLEIEFTEKIQKFTEEIYQLAGVEFNINSPKQLGEVLFEKLHLPPIKKTKTGYSTNAEVLEKLKEYHEIVPKILEYRQVTKLKTTYVDGLLNIINPITKRIHSNFNQTVTTTGRISSTEPNLQNIPIKLEMGRRLRKVFIAEEEHQLIDADYSQIELRVLAHISGDENLIDAFLKDQDIHTRTASEIFKVPMEEVTPSMRSSAKAVNFGIVYGISDFGLSENLNIPRYKAKKYIESYLEKYSLVKKYMKHIVSEAKEKKYVKTILSRRRYLPELSSNHFTIRSFGERMAMNTPIQGSAADIIKIAMVNVHQKLKEQNYQAKLILQVHDELIIEAPLHEVIEVAAIVKESMEGAMNLVIPLKVDLSYGNNWYEAK